MILLPKRAKAPLLHRMTNLLPLIDPVHSREAHMRGKISVVSVVTTANLQQAQLLPRE